MKGSVKWFSNQKGFGFLIPSDGSKEGFVHHTSILMEGYKTLAEKQEVEFDLESTDKGPRAVNVRPLSAVN